MICADECQEVYVGKTIQLWQVEVLLDKSSVNYNYQMMIDKMRGKGRN